MLLDRNACQALAFKRIPAHWRSCGTHLRRPWQRCTKIASRGLRCSTTPTFFLLKVPFMSDFIPTCDLCDTHKADTSGAFRVLPPVFRDFGGRHRFAGPVLTIKCHEDNSLVKAMLDTPGEGRVLVVDGGGSLRRALVGGNLGAAGERNGWAGIVVDGCVRDVAELAPLQLGIKALASMPLPTEKRNEGQRDVAVQIQGVWVRPGDWLYADEDGIVVSDRRLG